MKKVLIACLCLFLLCLSGCKKGKKLIVEVVEQQCAIGQNDIKNNLLVYFAKKPNDYITNYDILNFDSSKLGKQTITIVYQDYKVDALIEVVNEPVSSQIIAHQDYLLKTSRAISSSNPLLTLNDALLNVVRRKDKIAIYRFECPYETDNEGYEVAVNRYGQVEEIGNDVKMPEYGMICSVAGTRINELKQIQVGDFVVWANNTIYVYRNSFVKDTHVVYSLFDELYRYYQMVPADQKKQLAQKLNQIIPTLDSLYEQTYAALLDQATQELKVLLPKREEFTFQHQHVYSMTNITKYEKMASTTSNNYLNTLITLRNSIIDDINIELEKKIPHDYQYIHQSLEKIDEILQNFDEVVGSVYSYFVFRQSYLKINDYIEIIYSQLIDNQIDKTRGMWYYPFVKFQGVNYYDDTSKQGIINTLTAFKNMGINEILITPYHEGTYIGAPGYMVYDSDYYLEDPNIATSDYEEYGKDYLKCFISEAHKLGISVTAYTQTFMGYMRALKEKHEDYYQIDYYGNKAASFGVTDVYYYDVCNDEVQNLLLNWYKELVTRYEFDHVEFDLIRFPNSNLYQYLNVDTILDSTTIVDYGYSEASMNKFKDTYHITGDLKVLIRTSKEVRQNWLTWKKETLTNFVKEASTLIRLIRPNIRISAAVLSNANSAINECHQDYPTWLEQGYIDTFEPMAYTNDVKSFESQVATHKQNSDKYDTELRVGLGAKLSEENTLIDLKEIKVMDSYGSYLIFCVYYYYRDHTLNQLLTSNHHYDFISDLTSDEEYLAIYIKDTLDMITNYYSPMLDDDFTALKMALNTKDINNIITAIQKLNDTAMKNYLYQRFSTLKI